ncbi:MAG: GAF domain-containing protein [Spirochaetota bacterium]
MIAAPIPNNDIERLASLHALQLLDTIEEERFDRITRLASQLLGVNIALVSLVDENRQWFKSKCGLDAPETPRDISFCGHAIMKDEIFYIPNSLEDERFHDNPLVTGPPHVIFYAGKPLKTKSGHNIGTLCMIHDKPKRLSPEEFQLIEDIGKIAENEINVMTLSRALIIQKESEEKVREVMDNVDEGLFSINPNGRIGEKFSLAFANIFQTDSAAGQEFIAFLRNYISTETIETVKDFVNLLFQDHLEEEMLLELNPLVQEKFRISDTDKYLNFNFKRVLKENNISHIVATVSDITKKVELTRELAAAEKKSQSLMEKTFDVLQIEPVLLHDFLQDVETELSQCLELLESNTGETDKERIDALFRSIHSVKGDAALLGLNTLASQSHSLEDKISQIRKQGNLHRETSNEITTVVTELQRELQDIQEIIGKLANFQENFSAEQNSNLLLQTVERQAAKLLQGCDKRVKLALHEFAANKIPIKYRKITKDILVQFTRNALDHGIETPEERTKSNKVSVGCITISSEQKDNYIGFTFHDDGRGLQMEKLKTVAKSKNIANVDTMTDEELHELIYRPGFSTAEKVTVISGRGVGMDIVKKRVDSVGGKIAIASQEGQYSSFTVFLPI